MAEPLYYRYPDYWHSAYADLFLRGAENSEIPTATTRYIYN